MDISIIGHRYNNLWGFDRNSSVMIEDKYAKLYNNIKELLESFRGESLTVHLVPMLGVSTLTIEIINELKASGMNIEYELYIPFREYENRWSAGDDLDLYNKCIENSSGVHFLSDNTSLDVLSDINTYYMDANLLAIDKGKDRVIIVTNSELKKATLNKTLTSKTLTQFRKKLKGTKSKPSEYKPDCLIVLDANPNPNTNGDNDSSDSDSNKKGTKKKSSAGKVTLEELDLWVNNMDNFIVIDLETTGYSYKSGARITDIGAFEISGNNIVSKYEQLVNPGIHIPDNISVLTGITDIMVQRKPRIEQVLPILYQYIGNKTLVIHNAPFDYNQFIKPLVHDILCLDLDLNVLCTLKMSRLIVPTDKHDLKTTYEFLTGKTVSNQAHRASADALMTAEIAIRMREHIKANYEAIKELILS